MNLFGELNPLCGAAANGLTYGLPNKNALTDCAKRKSYTKEIAEIFLCLSHRLLTKYNDGVYSSSLSKEEERGLGEPTEKPRLKLQKRINRRCFTLCWRVSSRRRRALPLPLPG